MAIMNSRETFNNQVERSRVLSDNYKAYIIYGKEYKKIDLSDYGLKSISWDSRDELIVRRSCVQREELAVVRRLGFDFDLRFAKNAPDLMLFFLDQTKAYLNGITITPIPYIDERITDYVGINKNLRTELKYRSKVANSGINSVFQKTEGKIDTTYLSATFDLKIEILHYDGGSKETYLFKNGVFYKPSQSTSENSSFIDEGVKAFFPTVETVGNLAYNPETKSIIPNLLFEMLNLGVDEREKPDKDRVIVNPNNRKLIFEK